MKSLFIKHSFLTGYAIIVLQGLFYMNLKEKDGYFINLFSVKPVMYDGRNYQPVLIFNVIYLI